MTDTADQVSEQRGGFGSLGTALGALVVAWAAAIASYPIHDNSFLTHLATGRLILDEGSVPSADPYSFTAPGASWTVQSWLMSVIYAAAERLGGGVGLRLVVLVLFVVAALLLWSLSDRAESLWGRFLVMSLALFVVTGVWSERPYMVGVIGLALTWMALRGSLNPWLLVPVLWVWANSHGSFPLAGVLAVAVAAGAWIDARREGRAPQLSGEVRVVAAALLGSLAAVIGPLGLRAVTFPLTALSKSDVLDEIVEWQAPEFRSVSERAFIVLVVVTAVGLVRCGRFRDAVPALAFTVMAMLAQRNVVLATVVLVPIAAANLPSMGSLHSRSRAPLGGGFTMVAGAFAALLIGSALTAPVTRLEPYPANAVAWLAHGDPGARLATQDFVGNLFEVLDGTEAAVFVDDRVDMYPSEIIEDSVLLAQGKPAWNEVLRRHHVGLVLWEREGPLASLIATSPEWRVVFSDPEWMIACHRGSSCDDLPTG